MKPVHWLEQSVLNAADFGWLSPSEAERAASFVVRQRREDWLLGRWTAKLAVCAFLRLPQSTETLAAIEIAAAPDGAPAAFVFSRPAPVSVSLSHRAGSAVCLTGPVGCALGCDLEALEPRSQAFVDDYFTEEEQGFLRRSRCEMFPAVLWSAKESVLKLLHTGLRLDTRSLTVRLDEEGEACGWRSFHALFLTGASFRGWWRTEGGLVKTAVAFPPAPPPVVWQSQTV
jgi:4'-phosphopantetheinyl transferase